MTAAEGAALPGALIAAVASCDVLHAQSTDRLLTPGGVAETLNIGLSTVWWMCREGRLPPPIYIGPKSPRWWFSELHAVVAACPRSVSPK